MRLMVAVSLLGALLTPACARRPPEAPPPTPPAAATLSGPPRGGLVIPPHQGERLTYCGRPLLLTVKVDSVNAPTTGMIAGLGEVSGDEGWGVHRDADEILYLSRGSARAIFGQDTTTLSPGSVVYVPQGVPHRLVSTGAEPMEYFFVIGPRRSADSFRRAARLGCDGEPVPPPPAAPAGAARVVTPAEGEHLRYCEIPLDFTLKVDSASTPGTRLRAATGRLRVGSEYGTHPMADEVAFITGGRGRAIVDSDTIPVEPGSTVFIARGTPHGFVNESDRPLEYLVVHSPHTSPVGFRRRASMPGPFCEGR